MAPILYVLPNVRDHYQVDLDGKSQQRSFLA